MHKEKLLKQLYFLLKNGADIKIVKITYKNGEILEIAFDDNDEEVIVVDKVENKNEKRCKVNIVSNIGDGVTL